MKQTIKEKVMRAWGTGEVVETNNAVCGQLKGVIFRFDPNRGEFSIRFDNGETTKVSFFNTIDIRFVGEAKLEGDSCMSLFKHGPCDEPLADDIESEVWEACKSKNGYYVIEDADGLELVCRTTATPEQMVRMAAAPEMRYALEMVTVKSRFSRITVGGCVVDRISVEFNPDQWRIITSALKKADGGE